MLLVESLQRLSGEVLQGRIGTDIDGEPRSRDPRSEDADGDRHGHFGVGFTVACEICWGEWLFGFPCFWHVRRSEEHTSELQSRGHLVCRLLLEKKKETTTQAVIT